MLSLDEAIRHCEYKAEELKKKAEVAKEVGNYRKEDCLECMTEHLQLAEWLKELKELRKFTKFVTNEVVEDTFKEYADSFAELACRKLIKLGYVELDENVYKKKENDE